MPRATTCGYFGWATVGVAGGEVSGLFPTVGGLPEAKHLIYLMLLEKRDGRVDPEESKDAGETILYLYGALIVAICEAWDKVWGYKCGQ
jgi:hypothetical protein